MGNIQNKDIDFLDSYWNELNKKLDRIADSIQIKIHGDNIVKSEGDYKMLKFVKYSDIETWCVFNMINNTTYTLNVLSEKIRYMILKGDGINIKPMLEKICSGRTRIFKYKNKSGRTINCGKGHFRFGDKAFLLSNKELDAIRKYFNYV